MPQASHFRRVRDSVDELRSFFEMVHSTDGWRGVAITAVIMPLALVEAVGRKLLRRPYHDDSKGEQ